MYEWRREGGKSKLNVIQNDLDQKREKKPTSLFYHSRGEYYLPGLTKLRHSLRLILNILGTQYQSIGLAP